MVSKREDGYHLNEIDAQGLTDVGEQIPGNPFSVDEAVVLVHACRKKARELRMQEANNVVAENIIYADGLDELSDEIIASSPKRLVQRFNPKQ